MLLAAPVTIVGGVIMALHQNAGMAWLLGASMPLLLIVFGLLISRMVPQFRMMQERLDKTNLVLREQIVGMRVVRAFVREPLEVERFQDVNDELTHTSLVAGRLMAGMFPIVMLFINVSNSAVIWFGANRIADGEHDDRRPDLVPDVLHADPHGDRDVDVRRCDGAARGGQRRADPGSARHRAVGRRTGGACAQDADARDARAA